MTALTDHQVKLMALELLRRHPVGETARIGNALTPAVMPERVEGGVEIHPLHHLARKLSEMGWIDVFKTEPISGEEPAIFWESDSGLVGTASLTSAERFEHADQCLVEMLRRRLGLSSAVLAVLLDLGFARDDGDHSSNAN